MIGPLGSLARTFNVGATAPGISDPRWNLSYLTGVDTLSGQRVSPDSAMQIISVQACVRILSTLIASLPVYIYRRTPTGKRIATEHPLYEVLHDQPNQFQTAFEFWEMMISHACYRGRGLARIFPGTRGAVDQLIPVHPDYVQVERLENGRLRYNATLPGMPKDVWTQDEVFDLRLISLDGYSCLSPIRLHREGVGLKAALEAHGANFFRNSARPSGILTSTNDFSADADKSVKDSWSAAQSGNHQLKPAVLWNGMKYEKIAITAEEAQFLESNKFQRTEIANIYGVPIYLLNDTENGASRASAEQFNQSFVDYTLRPWAKRIEQCIRRDLIVAVQAYFAEFNFDALLRGSTKERYEAHASAITNGWKSINEVRADENLNPIDGGDEYRTQMQNVPIAGGGGTSNEPPEPAEPDEPDDRAGASRVSANVGPLLDDAARRICAHERTWIGRRSKHADNGGRETFLEAYAAWSAKHREFIVETVTPIAKAQGRDVGTLWPMAERWTFETGEALASAETVSAIIDCEGREQRLSDAMREVFDG